MTSIVKPCPAVAGPAYQLPDKAKSALVGYGVVIEHVTFANKRVNTMLPVRPVPSVKLYENCPLSQVLKLNVAVPTGMAVVAGGTLKLPSVF